MKLKVGNIIIFIVGVLVVSFSLFFLLKKEEEDNLLINLTNKSLEEVMEYASLNNIKLNKTYEYDDLINKDYVISQSIEENTYEVLTPNYIRVIVKSDREIHGEILKVKLTDIKDEYVEGTLV